MNKHEMVEKFNHQLELKNFKSKIKLKEFHRAFVWLLVNASEVEKRSSGVNIQKQIKRSRQKGKL